MCKKIKKIILASILLLGSYISSAAHLTNLYILYGDGPIQMLKGSLEICSVNEHSGLLPTCHTRIRLKDFSPNAVAVSPDGNNIYFSTANNKIYSCKLVKSELDNCILKPGEFSNPKGMTFDSMHHLYVTNEGDNTITRCQLESNGYPSECSKIINVDYPPTSIAISHDNSYAYIGFSSNATVGVCPIQEDGNCEYFIKPGIYSKPVSLISDPLNKYLYLLNANNTYGALACELVDSGAGISDYCSHSPVDPYDRPTSGSAMAITVLNNKTFAYIAIAGDKINRCKVHNNNKFTECVRATKYYFPGTYSLAIAQKLGN